MSFKKYIFFTVILVFISFSLIILSKNENFPPQAPKKDIQFVKIAGQTIKVELAKTYEARERGLSGKISLTEVEGMLFLFDRPDKYSFWMKDMNFPIDIIWIGSDLRVVYIKKNALLSSYPENFSPDENAKYVLEVNSGFSEKNNLKKGNSVVFLP